MSELADKILAKYARRNGTTPDDSANCANTANPPRGVEWRPPSLLSSHRVPAFPKGVFPGWAERFVRELSEATQTPPDLAGGMVLAALAVAFQKRFLVEPVDGWREPLTLYVMSALPPANRKSAVVRAVSDPLFEWERREAERLRPLIDASRAEHEVRTRKRQKLIADLAAADDTEEDSLRKQLEEISAEIAANPLMAEPRLLVDDVTPEKLSTCMFENSGRIGVLTAEDDLLAVMAGRYDKAGKPNIGLFLKAHCGDRHRVDRGSRPTEFIDSPALSAGFCVQPEVLVGLLESKTFRGRGVLGRILYALPESLLGRREIEPRPMSKDTLLCYGSLMGLILGTPLRTGDDGEIVPEVLHLSPEAAELFRRFRQSVENELSELGRFAHITDWAGKLPGAVARIAGLLHASEDTEKNFNVSGTISGATMKNAIRLGDYYAEHAIAAFRLMGSDKATDDAKYILKWIEKRGLEQFTKGRFAKADDLDQPLVLLESHQYIADVTPPAPNRPGRKPSPTYVVNPLYGGSQYSHISPDDG